MLAPRKVALLLSALAAGGLAARIPRSVVRRQEDASFVTAGPRLTGIPLDQTDADTTGFVKNSRPGDADDTSFVKNTRPTLVPSPPNSGQDPITDKPTETSYSEIIVTGTDGGIATFVPTRNTEYASVTSTITTTDEDGDDIIIFPGGWWWFLKGPPNPNAPKPPSTPPGPNPNPIPPDPNNPDDPDKPSSTECQKTPPPDCTRTISYISRETGFEARRTTFGSCSMPTRCVTGEQSTTTTTIATSVHAVVETQVIPSMGSLTDEQNKLYQNEIDYIDFMFPISKHVFRYKKTKPGHKVKNGIKLRILTVGDSITAGFADGDGKGYRKNLREGLSENKVVWAGVEEESKANGVDAWHAAYPGQTIKFITDKVGKSLKQRPNLILVAAGTNDMNDNDGTNGKTPIIAKEGNDPKKASERLGELIDKIVDECPDAVVLVAKVINVCDDMKSQQTRTKQFNKLIPSVVKERSGKGKHVAAVDFTGWDKDGGELRDCVHPTDKGYDLMGDWWYSFVAQIDEEWLSEPEGNDPDRENEGSDANGGLDTDIPAPDWGTIPINKKSAAEVKAAAEAAKTKMTQRKCNANPTWKEAGKIAEGIGSNGDWKYKKNWQLSTDDKWGGNGKVADGIGRDWRYVRLVDMDGDGKADYVWVDPNSGEILCWINNLPEHWTEAGNNKGVIGSGVTGSKYVYLADLNGDGATDYLVVNPENGSVKVWWNYGPDADWDNGWKFVEGGEIASGVPHANLATLRFPDINGDGRADYVYIGAGGSLRHWLNVGGKGSTELLFHDQQGIATGAINGDGRDDYLIWDNDAGLTGFLNQRTHKEGVPVFINQGPEKTIADGINKDYKRIRLADLDGDGKADYAYVDDNGGLQVWYNRGECDDSMVIDGIRFADVDGDGADDYIWVDPKSGAPTIYLNKGPNENDVNGWLWEPINSGNALSFPSDVATGPEVKFGDVDGDGYSDYLNVEADTGKMDLYWNNPKYVAKDDWFEAHGTSASGLGKAKNVRFADIDGDGLADYIYLKENGGTVIYKSTFANKGGPYWKALPEADASGIGQRPEEIQFYDINGDGLADYVWTQSIDGAVRVWLNQYPEPWKDIGVISGDAGTSGNNIRWATLQEGGRADFIIIDPKTGAIGAWLNSCDNLAPELILVDTPPVCNKESDFPGHVPIQESWAEEPPWVCDDWFGNIDKRVTDGFNEEKIWRDHYNHKVRYRVQWLEGCETELGGRKDMDVLNPMEDYSVRCRDAFQMPWEYCWDENNGVGAYQDIRCLRYSIEAGV
ncbi:hypothetical protein LRP88_12530 [Fusarium phalaenopsidis]